MKPSSYALINLLGTMRFFADFQQTAVSVIILLVSSYCYKPTEAFQIAFRPLSSPISLPGLGQNRHVSTSLSATSATVSPNTDTVIGTVGRGYISILVAKLAAHRSHGKSWIICPSTEIGECATVAKRKEH